jgi:hypothetical protein
MQWRIWKSISGLDATQLAQIPKNLHTRPPPCITSHNSTLEHNIDEEANIAEAFRTNDEEDDAIMRALWNGVPQAAILAGYYDSEDHKKRTICENDTELSCMDLYDEEYHKYFVARKRKLESLPMTARSDGGDSDASAATATPTNLSGHCNPVKDEVVATAATATTATAKRRRLVDE